MSNIHTEQQQSDKYGQNVVLNKLGEYRPTGYFMVLMCILAGYGLFAVGHHTALEEVFGVNGFYPLPTGSLQVGFFAGVGVLLRHLIGVIHDAREQKEDLPVYAVLVLSEMMYAPVLAIILIHFTLSSAGETFTSFVAVLLGIFNRRLARLLYRQYCRWFGQEED